MDSRQFLIDSELGERLVDSDTPHGQQTPENPFPVLSRQHGGLMISVMVGQNTVWNSQRFTIHKNLLDLVSRRFPPTGWTAGGRPFDMTLPNDCPAAFEALCNYAYTGMMRRSAPSSPRHTLDAFPSDLFWFELYKVSERYEIPYLRREAYRHLIYMFSEDEDEPPSDQFIYALFAPFCRYDNLREHVVYHTAYWIHNQMGDEYWANVIASCSAAYGQAAAVCLAANNVSHGEWDRGYPLKDDEHLGFDIFRATPAAAGPESDNRSPTIRGDNPQTRSAPSVPPQRALSPPELRPSLPPPLLPLPIPSGSPTHLLAPRAPASSFAFRDSGTLTSPTVIRPPSTRYSARRDSRSRSPQLRSRTSFLNRYPVSTTHTIHPRQRRRSTAPRDDSNTVLPSGSLLLLSQPLPSSQQQHQPSRAATLARSSLLPRFSSRAALRSGGGVNHLLARRSSQRGLASPRGPRWRELPMAQTLTGLRGGEVRGRGEGRGSRGVRNGAEVGARVEGRAERSEGMDEEEEEEEEEEEDDDDESSEDDGEEVSSVDMFESASSGEEEGEGDDRVVAGAESLIRAARAETVSERGEEKG